MASKKLYSKAIKGMPGESYKLIKELDSYICMVVSSLDNTGIVDLFMSQQVTWRIKYPIRKKVVESFIKFTSGGSPSRALHLKHTHLVKRSELIEMCYTLATLCDRHLKIVKGVLTDISDADEKAFDYLSKAEPAAFDIIEFAAGRIRNTLDMVVKYFSEYVVALLLRNRHGLDSPEELTGAAYQGIMMMINEYNTTKSKIGFANYVQFHARKMKGIVIKDQSWGLNPGDIVFAGDAIASFVHKKQMKDLNSSLYENDEPELPERLRHLLPECIYNVLALDFSLLNPLAYGEKIIMSG